MKRWKQYDELLNSKPAWNEIEFPNADLHYFKECGCLVTSLTNLLIKYNFESDDFSPWTLNEKLKASGGFTSGADLYGNAIEKLYPIKFCGREKYTKEKLDKFIDSGYALILIVRGTNSPTHYVLVESKTEISDPNSENSNYPDENDIFFILKYKFC